MATLMGISREMVAIGAVREASRYLTRHFFDQIKTSQEKDYLDRVSEHDKESEKIIISEIEKFFPEDGILSEESSEKERNTKYRWIIDPLDGTHNFLDGLNEWGILLALEEEGQVILGVCCFPIFGEFLLAEKGKGAFLNSPKIEVSKKATELRGQMFCSDGILRKKPKEILGDIERFCSAGCRLRVYGSSAFGFTRVALGRAAVATNRARHPWDVAAPALLVEEAGGSVTDENGGPWRVDSENLIATNRLLHEEALSIFRNENGKKAPPKQSTLAFGTNEIKGAWGYP